MRDAVQDPTQPDVAASATEFDMEQMRVNANAAAALLRSLANEDRLLLLCQLSQEELCVGDIEQRIGLRQPSLSQQLGVLRREGLVSTRRQGKHIFYRVDDPRALALLQTLYGLFCASTAGS